MTKEFIYKGRRCTVIATFRTRRSGTNWGYHNTVCIRYTDGTSETVPSGKFHKAAKPAQQRVELKATLCNNSNEGRVTPPLQEEQ